MNGILVIDKPADFTSFDVIAVMRRMLGTRKLGHAGTLDPMATGVLPVFAGKAARAIDLLPNHDKIYLAGFELGVVTDTQDSTGKIINKQKISVPRGNLENAVNGFKGEISQIPPMYSAVKKNGQRLYDLARQGIEIEREARSITVYDIALTEYNEESGRGVIQIHCSKGTYVRTLCHDIGGVLGCGAIMTSLRRVMAAGFTEDGTITLGEARELSEKSCLTERLMPVESVFSIYPEIHVTPAQAVRFKNGGTLSLDRITVSGTSGFYRVHGDEFLGLGCISGDELIVKKLFCE